MLNKSKNPVLCLAISAFIGLWLSSPLLANSYQTALGLYNKAKFQQAEDLLHRSIPKAKSKSEKADLYKLLGVIKYQQNRKESAKHYFELAHKTDSGVSLPPMQFVESSIYGFFKSTKPKSGSSSVANAPSRPKPKIKAPPRRSVTPVRNLSAKTPPRRVTVNKPVQRVQPRAPLRPKLAAKPARKAAPPKRTILMVNSPQKEASVSVNGIIMGKVNTPLDVSPGRITVEITADGYIPQKKVMMVIKNQTQRLNVALRKIPPKKPKPKPKPEAVAKTSPKAKTAAGATIAKTSRSKVKKVDPFSDSGPKRAKRIEPAENSLAAEFARDQAPPPAPYQGPYGQPQYQQPPAQPQQPVYNQPIYQPPAQTYVPPQQPIYQPLAQPYVQPQPYAQPASPSYGAPPPPPVVAPVPAQEPAWESELNSKSAGDLYGNGKKRKKKKLSKRMSAGDHMMNFVPFGIPQFARGQWLLGSIFALGEGGLLGFYAVTYNEINATTAETNDIINTRQAEIDAMTDASIKEMEQENLDQFRNERVNYTAALEGDANNALYGFVGMYALNVLASYMIPEKKSTSIVNLFEWQNHKYRFALNPDINYRLGAKAHMQLIGHEDTRFISTVHSYSPFAYSQDFSPLFTFGIEMDL